MSTITFSAITDTNTQRGPMLIPVPSSNIGAKNFDKPLTGRRKPLPRSPVQVLIPRLLANLEIELFRVERMARCGKLERCPAKAANPAWADKKRRRALVNYYRTKHGIQELTERSAKLG